MVRVDVNETEVAVNLSSTLCPPYCSPYRQPRARARG